MFPKVKASWLLSVLILCVVVAIWVVVLLRGETHNELLPELAGCFRSTTNASLPSLRVSENGHFTVGSISTTAKVIKDKQGVSFEPAKRVFLLYEGMRGSFEIDDHNPLLFALSDDHQTVSVPSTNGPFMVFARIKCAR
jgi:hypothetical protein